jgi:hypothetical protein
MRPTLRHLAVPLITLGLLGLAAPSPAAPTPAGSATVVARQPLVVKTVMIGGKRVRFVLAVDADERAFVQMKFRRDGRWRTVASDRTDCNYYDGSHDAFLQVQKPVRQVFVGWTGPGEDGTAEYGGYNVRQKTIVMYGAEACTGAG